MALSARERKGCRCSRRRLACPVEEAKRFFESWLDGLVVIFQAKTRIPSRQTRPDRGVPFLPRNPEDPGVVSKGMNARRIVILAATFSLPGLAGAPRALAGCALPPEPTVYLFLSQHPSYRHGKVKEIRIVDEQGASLDYEKETLSGTRDVQVVRLRVSAKRGTILLRVRTGEGINQMDSTATYGIDTKWCPPAKSGSTRIVAATYTYSDGCPASNGFVLTIEPFAAAYRVTGDNQDWVVPGHRGQDEKGASVGEIYTGQVGCVDFVLPTDKPLNLEVTPLFSNGQEGETFRPGCRSSRHGSGLSCRAPVWSEFSGSVKSSLDDR
jgi:hypothetical protein